MARQDLVIFQSPLTSLTLLPTIHPLNTHPSNTSIQLTVVLVAL